MRITIFRTFQRISLVVRAGGDRYLDVRYTTDSDADWTAWTTFASDMQVSRITGRTVTQVQAIAVR